VALARAIYSRPKLIILDEPNSNLDEAGEQALLQTLATLRTQGASVLVITHRTSILPQADKLLMLREGQVAMFGARDEVLAALQKAQNDAQSAQLGRQTTSSPASTPMANTPSTTSSKPVSTSTSTVPIRTATVPAGPKNDLKSGQKS
jgi:ABC-type multidrug transport system ATPase subunit